MGGSKAPAAPVYQPPPAYIAPKPFVMPNLTTPYVAPAGEIMKTGNQIEGNPSAGSVMPTNLQLGSGNPSLGPNGNPMDPAGMAQNEAQYYQQFGNPAVAAAEAGVSGGSGQGYGSYGGALVAQTKASQDQAAYQQGLNYAQQNYNNILSGRSSYLSGGPQMATNQNNAQVQATENMNANMMGVAGMQNAYNTGTVGAQNAYNANTAQGANSYGLQNYQNQQQAYQQQMQQQQNTWLGIGTLGLGLLGGGVGKAAGGALGNMFGGSGGSSGGSNPGLISPSYNPGFGSASQGSSYTPSAMQSFGSQAAGLNSGVY